MGVGPENSPRFTTRLPAPAAYLFIRFLQSSATVCNLSFLQEFELRIRIAAGAKLGRGMDPRLQAGAGPGSANTGDGKAAQLCRRGPRMYQDGYVFKRAVTTEEIEQIHRLNYRTFVTEIPQHHDTGDGRLVDKFHAKNTYFIAVRRDQVVGMISIHDQPPFSIADRLPDPSILTHPDSRPIEVRLLAVAPEQRKTTVMMGLVSQFYEYARAQGYTHAYLSGVVDRVPLYRQFGFEPLGPAVRSGEASFVPMGITISRLVSVNEPRHLRWRKRMERRGSPRREAVCLLPGPVSIPPAV